MYEQVYPGLVSAQKFIVEWVLQDKLEPVRKSLTERDVSDDTILGDPTLEFIELRYLKSNPIACGLMVGSIQLTNQKEMRITFDRVDTIAWMPHLYNASLKLGRNTTEWPDMEKVIALHGENNLFTGGRPTTYDDCQYV